MFRHVLKVALLSFFSVGAQALPIIDADAFVTGDHKAVYEIDSGLTWMDFGVNSHESYNDVIGKLETDYKGWRLPTSAEVKHLWINIFSGTPGFIMGDNNGTTESMDSRSLFESIFDIFGYNDISALTYNYPDGSSESWPIYRALGVSGYDSLQPDIFVIWSPLDDIHSDISIYTKVTGGLDLSEIHGTLLVKEQIANVPEPASIILLFVGLIYLVTARRARY